MKPQQHPPVLWCDNTGAAAMSSGAVFHARTKHVEIDVHFVRERVNSKELHVRHVSTAYQIDDILIKT